MGVSSIIRSSGDSETGSGAEVRWEARMRVMQEPSVSGMRLLLKRLHFARVYTPPEEARDWEIVRLIVENPCGVIQSADPYVQE